MEDQNIPVAQKVQEPQPQEGGAPRQGASGRAITTLILGILSIMCMGFFAGIPAIIIGTMEMRAIKAGHAPVAGESAAKAGYILGIIGTALTCLSMLIFFIVAALGISMGSLSEMQNAGFSI